MSEEKTEMFCDNPKCAAHQPMAFSETLQVPVRGKLINTRRRRTVKGVFICTLCQDTFDFVATARGAGARKMTHEE